MTIKFDNASISEEIERVLEESIRKSELERKQKDAARIAKAKQERANRPDPYWQSVIKRLEADLCINVD